MSINEQALNDVRRKINEVLTKQDEKIVVGWRPGLEQKREEGEVWEASDGSQWTVKNGIRQKVTKLDSAKTPWWCPKCQKTLNHKLDVKFWRIRGHCFDCNIKEETKIRAQGAEAWKAYEEKLMKANYIAELKDDLNRLIEVKENLSSPEIIHADEQEGRILMIEKWNVDLDKVREDIQKDIDLIQQRLQEVEGEPNEQNS
ncbi:MAG TPA: hypothetical protein PLS49_08400 [Candidatus Woesebacteria bacterium]|nr:hypothetical protein [Candidatus Woesebacteria bacterium]